MRRLVRFARGRVNHLLLPGRARAERERDNRRELAADAGAAKASEAALLWLFRAQDGSASSDGGVARHFSLIHGWARSYPETTGYILSTLLETRNTPHLTECRERARRMGNWLLSIQFEEGAFPGGVVGEEPVVPVIFNTGQILLGLVSAAREFGEPYRNGAERAAAWLVAAQDPDGAWRKHMSPFAKPGVKVYDTHVAWALLEAARLFDSAAHARAGLRNVEYALSRQRANGFFDDNCLSDPEAPLTHTIGYALRGILEAYRYSRDGALLQAARRAADGILVSLGPDGYLAGRLRPDWHPAVHWVCLTGSVQIAHCWLLLYAWTGDERYLDAGCAANAFVRRTLRFEDCDGVNGGVKGSFPVDGAYNPYMYLNWAAKFLIDSNRLELDILAGQAPA